MVIGTIRFLALLAGLLTSVLVHAVLGARVTWLPLEPGQTFNGTLSGGDVARHSVTLGAGESASIVFGHRNIDVTLRLLQNETEPDIEITSDGPSGELRLRIHATRAGVRSLEVAAAHSKSSPGSYNIRVDDVGAGTAADRQRYEAHQHYSRARRLRSTGAYAEALSHAEQAVGLREKALGPDSLEVARSLLLVGQIKHDQAQFGIAENLYLRARGIAERASERHDLVYAEILDSLARNQFVRARFAEGERLAKDALEIRERTVGSEHYLAAASLGTLSDLYVANSDVRQAQITADRALEIAAKAYEPTDIRYGDFTNRVARVEVMLGNYARAEALYLESLQVRENSLGPESLAAADSLTGLARVVLLKNENVKAEQLFLKTVAIKEKILGPDHLEIGNLLHNLAQLHLRRRDYPTAIALNTKSLALKEKALGSSHPLIKATLNNLGLVYWRQGDYRRAEEFYRRSLAMAEQFSGPDSLELVPPLANLGIIAKETGNYDLAETHYRRALAINEKNLGPNHPDVVTQTESLGILYRDSGDFPRAVDMLQRTLDISLASRGAEHPFVARHLANLGQLYWAMDDWDKAFTVWQRFLAIEEQNLPLNLSIGSERQKLAYFEPRLSDMEETISFHVQRPTDHAGARDLAITTLLQRKGRVLDALADNMTAFRARSGPDDQSLLDRLSRVTADLAATVLSNSTQPPLAERQRRTATLAAERERLEIEVHRRSAGYLDPPRPLTLADVQTAVPADAALLEFSVYRPRDPRASFESGKQFGAPRYVAYVVRHGGEPQWKDLGPAEEINRYVDVFRSALADPGKSSVTRVATELHQLLIAPLQPLFGDARHLLISPDGPLNLIPFEALRRIEGRYLVEDVAISYLTTGRDLVRMVAPRPVASRAVVFADPAFGEPSASPTTRASATAGAPSPQRPRSVIAARDLSSVYFAPLAGTAGEAQRIRALFPEIELKLGAQATEKALKTVQAPRILHVATHGFFLENDTSREVKRSSDDSRDVTATAGIDNPLLRSGLAFAGANLPRAGGDDGILTALEAANLNLWGTQLVTLSACDTGIGVVRNGEGVYGLRRAFFLAGAESIVMSLWPVSDLNTREMMTGYYAGLKEGLGRGAALRRMQLQMLKRKGRAHPFYWASFIQAGKWASLDAQQ